MQRVIIKYGVYGGIISIALGLINWFTVAQAFGPIVSQTVGWLTIIVSLMCVPLGIRYYRDRINGGNLSFGRGFHIGMGITSIFTLISFFYSVLFFVIAGDSFDEWSRRGMSEAEIVQLEARMAQAPEFVSTPWFQALLLAISILLIGLFICLVSSLMLKRSTN